MLSPTIVCIQMAAKSKEFDEILISAIDDALLSLGSSAQQSIYFHLEKNFNIKKLEIPHKLEMFQDSLEKIFGLGVRFLEILIMKKLYSKLESPLEMNKNESLEFIKYVNAARRNFLKEDPKIRDF